MKAGTVCSVLLGVVLPWTVSAGTRTSTLQVSVTIVNDCHVATDGAAGRAAVTLACTPGTPYRVVLQQAAGTAATSGLYRVIPADAVAAFGGMADGTRQSVRIGSGSRVIATIWY